MKFNRKKFWDNYKIQFGAIGEKEQGIVPGIEFLLKGFETYHGWWADVRHIAYALATTKYETAHTFHPVREAYWLSETWRQNNLRYYPWYGRGYVQLTWERNYEAMNEKLPKHFPEFIEQFEQESGKKFNLMDADQVMHPAIAFGIMTVGMFRGSFTGKAFKHYINDSKTDYKEARRIINGTDKQNTIASIAVKFEKVLRASLVTETFTDLQDGELLDIPNQIEEFEPVPNQVDDIPAVDQSTTNTATDEVSDQPTEADAKQSTPSASGSAQTNIEIESRPQIIENAVVKPDGKGFMSRMWKKLTGVAGGNVTFDIASEKIQQAGALGLSQETWTKITYTVVIASLIYIAYELYHYWMEQKREREITSNLVSANSGDNKIVTLVNKDEIDYVKSKGVNIVYR